jgi:hypothetical protein
MEDSESCPLFVGMDLAIWLELELELEVELGVGLELQRSNSCSETNSLRKYSVVGISICVSSRFAEAALRCSVASTRMVRSDVGGMAAASSGTGASKSREHKRVFWRRGSS